MKIKFLNQKNTTTLIVLFVCVCSLTSINGQTKHKYGVMTFNKAINIAEKQGMLLQRMGKDYLYMVENSDDSKASKDLLTNKIIFEKQNEILLKNTDNKVTKAKIQKANSMWSAFKKLIVGTPNFDNAKKIIDQNTDILYATEGVVNSITVESKNANTHLTGQLSSDDAYLEKDKALKKILAICGRQRMLTQRLALYYLANDATLKDKNTEQMLKNVYNEIEGINTPLLISDFDNDEIDQKIAEALALWDLVKKDKLMKLAYDDKEIYNLSNNLTKAYNAIITLYEHIEI